MRTTSQPSTNVGSGTVYQTSRASFKRSVPAQIACLRSANRFWNIRIWCYCWSSLTNVCSRRYTGLRAGSNPSKNFASMTVEIVNSGDRGLFGVQYPTATACTRNLQPHVTAYLHTLARMLLQCAFALLWVVEMYKDEQMWSVTIALTASNARHQDFRIHT